MLENVGIHLQWRKFYYIAHNPPSCTGCYSEIRPYNTPTNSFSVGEILLYYSSLSPILDTPLIFKNSEIQTKYGQFEWDILLYSILSTT